MEIEQLFKGCYTNQVILITGHTGFKGSWLTYWLNRMGATVIGYSLEVPSEPNHFKLLNLSSLITHVIGDVRDQESLKKVINEHRPSLIFHLAAQSLVRNSYVDPIETLNTNIMGTANLLECVRLSRFVKGVINVTSDKCYENFEDDRAYNEENRFGGYDPYSASKGAAEIVANSFRSAFFNPAEYGKKHSTILASVRAGNVIGGGDWAKDRIIPDIVRSADRGETTSIRSPKATRPWQHVLEPLSGYLILGQRMLEGDISVSNGWNFGPLEEQSLSVKQVISLAAEEWDKIKFRIETPENSVHEAKYLRLDCTKANEKLLWLPMWSAEKSISKAIAWYKKFYEKSVIDTKSDLEEYITTASLLKCNWAT